MKLEEAIQQKKFISEFQKAHLNILFSASYLNQQTTASLRPFGLTWQQFNVLRILRGRHPEPATVKLLTERMIDKTSNASRLVDKLLAKKLVERSTSQADRRRVDINITEAGLELLQQASHELEDGASFTGGSLTAEEAEQLNFLLDKFRTAEE
jgi:DNA-binding MarR family transcriptional regulator